MTTPFTPSPSPLRWRTAQLHASYTLTKDGEAADKALFVNHYDAQMTEPDAVEIAGVKTWNHGNNPEDKSPGFHHCLCLRGRTS